MCREHRTLPASKPAPPTPAQLGVPAGPVQLSGRQTHTRTRLPWLERMGWGREAEEGATLGGELLGLTQGAAASRESSLT